MKKIELISNFKDRFGEALRIKGVRQEENNLIMLEPMSTNPENTVQVYDPKKIKIKVIGKVVAYQGRV